jgi:putative membrane protein
MLQHFILMSVAPPLMVLSAPLVPMLRGLPRWFIRKPMHWFFTTRVQHLVHSLTHPAVIWIAMNVAYLGWHAPRAFELTFSSEAWHNTEHLCFFLTSIAFWWVILQPWPGRPRWPEWAAIPYLLSADLVNTILSALLTFSGRVIYPTYEHTPRVCSFTPLQDQIAAGSEMWVLNSTVFLIPAFVLTFRVLSPRFNTKDNGAPLPSSGKMKGAPS